MGYTPNFAAGDVLTAAAMNSIGEAWEAFGAGASWTSTGSQPALNNGTWHGEFCQINKLVIARYRVTMGSTTSYGSGTYRLALPVTASTSNIIGDIVGWGRYIEAGGLAYNGYVLLDTTARVIPHYLTTVVGAVADTPVTRDAPYQWANGDVMQCVIMYEAA